jgi:hypothetical protein
MLAVDVARDGFALVSAVYHPSCPVWLRELPAVQVLRTVLLQNYTRTTADNGREVVKRRQKADEGGDGRPPGHLRLSWPYDTDARWCSSNRTSRMHVAPSVIATREVDHDLPPVMHRDEAGTRQCRRQRPGQPRTLRKQPQMHPAHIPDLAPPVPRHGQAPAPLAVVHVKGALTRSRSMPSQAGSPQVTGHLFHTVTDRHHLWNSS